MATEGRNVEALPGEVSHDPDCSRVEDAEDGGVAFSKDIGGGG